MCSCYFYFEDLICRKAAVDGYFISPRYNIGGTYRFDFTERKWISLISHVTAEDLSETFPIALALDDDRPNVLYIACGENKPKKGVLAISEDYGETFYYERIPVLIHGNLNGRGTADRLFVDKEAPDTLYFASQQEGLYLSADRGKNWQKCRALPEDHLTFVTQVGNALLVGSAGVTTRKSNTLRGHSLYVSYDKGQTFTALEAPASHEIESCRLNGQVAQRFGVDHKYLYVTFASTGRRSYVPENGYSCDSGDTIDGNILRYPIDAEGRIGKPENITPGSYAKVTGIGQEKITSGQILDYGFSAISASPQVPGLLLAATIVKDDGDGIEETVHLNVYSLPKGPTKVIDILGDLGGFAFEDLDTPCDNSFADENGNRYITCCYLSRTYSSIFIIFSRFALFPML